MATVITAGNATNGLSFTADNTGALDIKTGTGAGTNAISISSSQVAMFTAAPIGAGMLTSSTSVASTSGTSIDFTGIPSWVKRITIVFSGVSTNSTNPIQVQIGSGSYTTSGYNATSGRFSSSSNSNNSTVGFIITSPGASDITSGNLILTNLTSNTWVASFSGKASTTVCCVAGGDVSLSGTLDRLRIIGSTTGVPTDTFDAGTINILYE